LGFHWGEAKNSLIQTDEVSNLLVFTNDRKIVAYFDYPRDKGDFSKLRTKISFSKNDAQFELNEEQNGIQKWKYFYPIVGK
jgi:hypothetical protein